MVSKKPVALVVGASRGIGRQVAVDLAGNGYAGMSSFTTFIALVRLTLKSCCCCKDYQRSFQSTRALSPKSQLFRFYHHNSCSRDYL
jgi:hypothetical protein